ncbi:MAG: tetratricopeptide repeat protein [Candidatus Omnitrophica bacterium]|nr:tetratricopeptide repeat protein [Candidatus Omnitrophota bacterium]
MRKKVEFLVILLLGAFFLQAADTDWLKLAIKAHQEGLYSLSNRQIDKFLKSNPESKQRDYAYLLRGVNHIQLKNLGEAEKSLATLISTFPESSFLKEAYSYLILVQLNQRKIEPALTAYSLFKKKFGPEEKLSSQLAQAFLSQGAKLFNQGNYRASQETLEKILTEFPEAPEYAPASYYLGLIEFQENRFQKASELFHKALSKDISQEFVADVYFKIGDCYLNTGRLEEAAGYYRKILSDFPNSSLTSAGRFNLAVIARRQGEYTQARQWLEEILKGKTTRKMAAMTLMELGRLAALEDNWTQAARHFLEIVDNYPESELFPEAFFQLGLVNFNQNNWKGAIDYFQRCLKETKDESLRVQAYFGLGYTFYKSGKITEAADYWKFILEKRPESTFASEVLFLLGRRNFENGDYQLAETYLKPLLSTFPGTNLAKLGLPLLIESLLQQKKLVEAKQLAEKHLAGIRNDESRVLFGKVLYLNGEKERARKVLLEVSKAQPALKAEALFYLGQIYLTAGKEDEAQDTFLEIITSYPQVNPWSRLAREALGKNPE